MKILITGISGQLGRCLVERLGNEHQIIAADRTMLDLSKPDTIVTTVRQIAPDLIINPAAYTAVDKAESEPELAATVNTHAVASLAEVAKTLNIPLIHYSTDYVYAGNKKDTNGKLAAYTESDPVAPLNIYGQTKADGEQAIRDTGCRHLIFRTSWVYSPYGKNFLLTMLKLANEREQLNIVNDQFGAPTSAITIADITAQIIAQMSSARDTSCAENWWKMHQGTYHLVNAGTTNWCDFTRAIVQEAQQAGLLKTPGPAISGIPAVSYPTPAKRPENSMLDLNKLKLAFGVSVPEWRESMQECIRYLK